MNRVPTPSMTVSNRQWINELPPHVLGTLEQAIGECPPWVVQWCIALPPGDKLDTLILMPPVFMKGLLNGDKGGVFELD